MEGRRQWASHRIRRAQLNGSTAENLANRKQQLQKFSCGEMSKEEVLRELREFREGLHRQQMQDGFDRYAFCWNTKPSHRPTQDYVQRLRRAGNIEERPSWVPDFFELSNKSVPFYVLPNNSNGSVSSCLRKSLACYLYEKWFHPYKSDIDFNQFIAKLIVPMDIVSPGRHEPPSAQLIDELSTVTQAIAWYITAAKRHLIARTEDAIAKGNVATDERPRHHDQHNVVDENAPEAYVNFGRWQRWNLYVSPKRIKQHYSLSSLFRSIGIIFSGDDWDSATDCNNIGKKPVYMFLTGADNPALSAPITFHAIEGKIEAVLQHESRKAVQTTLDTAVDFIMDLERREALASNNISKTDPNAETYYPKPKFPKAYDHYFENLAKWGPSSMWVDDKDTEWTGLGASADMEAYILEQQDLQCWRSMETINEKAKKERMFLKSLKE